ncbi:hypothetical protein Mx8p28 [Myxococcus phage Mx8]|uniref:p28 n=1 Tax=Myxococcus phage Mx8 TaxID=49964 RepID=Q94MU1_9CAUD|nr:hypothetical protein Mx8p28 [Myxococcus phage Mx8]AAK94363.1 p28 [Myxococcus phage Mx8]
MTCRRRPGKCRMCGNPRPASRKLYCSNRCGVRAFRTGRAPKKKRSVGLGPKRPLLGWTERELATYRVGRTAELLRDGVSVEAICERLGLRRENVYQIAHCHGITVLPAVYPYGVPAR